MRLDAQGEDLYTSADRAAAEAAHWYHHAGAFDETNRLAKTLRAWEPELLAYFDTGLTNGPTEGINRIIKAVAKASATPTPTTTASASSTAAPDTLNPPTTEPPPAPPTA